MGAPRKIKLAALLVLFILLASMPGSAAGCDLPNQERAGWLNGMADYIKGFFTAKVPEGFKGHASETADLYKIRKKTGERPIKVLLGEQLHSGKQSGFFSGETQIDGKETEVGVKVFKDSFGHVAETAFITESGQARVVSDIAANTGTLRFTAPHYYGIADVKGNYAFAAELVKAKPLDALLPEEALKLAETARAHAKESLLELLEQGYRMNTIEFGILTEDQLINGRFRKRGEVVFWDVASLRDLATETLYTDPTSAIAAEKQRIGEQVDSLIDEFMLRNGKRSMFLEEGSKILKEAKQLIFEAREAARLASDAGDLDSSFFDSRAKFTNAANLLFKAAEFSPEKEALEAALRSILGPAQIEDADVTAAYRRTMASLGSELARRDAILSLFDERLFAMSGRSGSDGVPDGVKLPKGSAALLKPHLESKGVAFDELKRPFADVTSAETVSFSGRLFEHLTPEQRKSVMDSLTGLFGVEDAQGLFQRLRDGTLDGYSPLEYGIGLRADDIASLYEALMMDLQLFGTAQATLPAYLQSLEQSPKAYFGEQSTFANPVLFLSEQRYMELLEPFPAVSRSSSSFIAFREGRFELAVRVERDGRIIPFSDVLYETVMQLGAIKVREFLAQYGIGVERTALDASSRRYYEKQYGIIEEGIAYDYADYIFKEGLGELYPAYRLLELRNREWLAQSASNPELAAHLDAYLGRAIAASLREQYGITRFREGVLPELFGVLQGERSLYDIAATALADKKQTVAEQSPDFDFTFVGSAEAQHLNLISGERHVQGTDAVPASLRVPAPSNFGNAIHGKHILLKDGKELRIIYKGNLFGGTEGVPPGKEWLSFSLTLLSKSTGKEVSVAEASFMVDEGSKHISQLALLLDDFAILGESETIDLRGQGIHSAFLRLVGSWQDNGDRMNSPVTDATTTRSLANFLSRTVDPETGRTYLELLGSLKSGTRRDTDPAAKAILERAENALTSFARAITSLPLIHAHGSYYDYSIRIRDGTPDSIVGKSRFASADYLNPDGTVRPWFDILSTRNNVPVAAGYTAAADFQEVAAAYAVRDKLDQRTLVLFDKDGKAKSYEMSVEPDGRIVKGAFKGETTEAQLALLDSAEFSATAPEFLRGFIEPGFRLLEAGTSRQAFPYANTGYMRAVADAENRIWFVKSIGIGFNPSNEKLASLLSGSLERWFQGFEAAARVEVKSIDDVVDADLKQWMEKQWHNTIVLSRTPYMLGVNGKIEQQEIAYDFVRQRITAVDRSTDVVTRQILADTLEPGSLERIIAFNVWIREVDARDANMVFYPDHDTGHIVPLSFDHSISFDSTMADINHFKNSLSDLPDSYIASALRNAYSPEALVEAIEVIQKLPDAKIDTLVAQAGYSPAQQAAVAALLKATRNSLSSDMGALIAYFSQ